MKKFIFPILQTILFSSTPFIVYPFVDWFSKRYPLTEGWGFYLFCNISIVFTLQVILLVISWYKVLNEDLK